MSSTVVKWALVLAVIGVLASPVMAQPASNPVEVSAAGNVRTGPGLGIGLSVVGIGIGLGLIGFAALSGVARQPEQAGAIRGLMILMAALVEGAGIIGILFSLAIVFLG